MTKFIKINIKDLILYAILSFKAVITRKNKFEARIFRFFLGVVGRNGGMFGGI
jgi:hypothetical protein